MLLIEPLDARRSDSDGVGRTGASHSNDREM
jgi:hypothetical protein